MTKMSSQCIAITLNKTRCSRLVSNLFCVQHERKYNKLYKSKYNIYDILNVLEVFEDKLMNTNIYLCNKDLYINYLKTTYIYNSFTKDQLYKLFSQNLIPFKLNIITYTSVNK